MPRVLRIITRLNRGGPLRQLCALVPGLAELGWDGPVLAGIPEPTEPDGSEDLRAVGADVIALPELGRGIDPVSDARALRAVIRHLRRDRPALIHTHMGKAGAIGRAAGRLAGIPVVHTLHGHHFDAGGSFGRGVRMGERVLGRLGTALICLTPSQRRDVVERHRVLPARRVHVIEPGFDVAGFQSRAGAAAPPADGRFHVVWTGRFVDVKRPLALLDVIAATPQDVHLTAYGDGPLRSAFEAAIKARDLAARVVSAGPVDDVAPHVAAAHAFLLTSASEGVPLSMLEAMVLGVPVVVPAVGGIPDVLTPGQDGLLAPAGDDAGLANALMGLAADPVGAARLGAAARDMAATRFAGTRLARETADLYRRLLADT